MYKNSEVKFLLKTLRSELLDQGIIIDHSTSKLRPFFSNQQWLFGMSDAQNHMRVNKNRFYLISGHCLSYCVFVKVITKTRQQFFDESSFINYFVSFTYFGDVKLFSRT